MLCCGYLLFGYLDLYGLCPEELLAEESWKDVLALLAATWPQPFEPGFLPLCILLKDRHLPAEAPVQWFQPLHLSMVPPTASSILGCCSALSR